MTYNILSATNSAVAHITKFLPKNKQNAGVRISVVKSGCTGFAYDISVEDLAAENDIVFEDNGVKFYINAESAPFLKGSVIDCRKVGLNEQFEIRNPNVKSQCGCGESFSVEQ